MEVGEKVPGYGRGVRGQGRGWMDMQSPGSWGRGTQARETRTLTVHAGVRETKDSLCP